MPAPQGKEIRIAVVGATGCGKTTFINLISRSNLPTGNGREDRAHGVRASKPFPLDGYIVTLIDTPGFDNTTRSDMDILSSIATYLSNTYGQGSTLAGVIYMHRISDMRTSGPSKQNFRIFRELCGDDTLQNVLVVTTMWSGVDRKVGEAREHALATGDFKPILKRGARLLRHNSTQASACAILRCLIDTQPETSPIQRELVEGHMDLVHTIVRAELRRALKAHADHHVEELKKLRRETKDAMKETRRELQQEIYRKQGIERTSNDLERNATVSLSERTGLESKITELENKNTWYAQQLESLQKQVAQLHKEVKTLQIEHKRCETELFNVQREAEKQKLEEGRKARQLAEAQRLHVARQEMEPAEVKKRPAEAKQAEGSRWERDPRPREKEKEKETEKDEPAERGRDIEIEKAYQEVFIELRHRTREGPFASRRRKQQGCYGHMFEETERTWCRTEEAYYKQDPQDQRNAEEARVRIFRQRFLEAFLSEISKEEIVW